MIWIILIFSFIFEAIFSNIVPLNSILTPLFFLISLSVIYPYLKHKKFTFLVICIVFGLVYDIAYTNLPFINTISYTICGVLIMLLYCVIKYTIYNCLIVNVLVVVFYRMISYLLLTIINYFDFSGTVLFRGIYNSLISNIIYGLIIFTILDLLSKIFNIKRSD